MIEMTGAISLRVHENRGAGDIPIAIPAAEDEDRQGLSVHFVPLNRRDLRGAILDFRDFVRHQARILMMPTLHQSADGTLHESRQTCTWRRFR